MVPVRDVGGLQVSKDPRDQEQVAHDERGLAAHLYHGPPNEQAEESLNDEGDACCDETPVAFVLQ